ncbi:MAG TPA: hypothetical protein VMI75_09795 [Polyangiaceae bacterium]|nr:hypothetical protein [Polyangiaceae bacterium]
MARRLPLLLACLWPAVPAMALAEDRDPDAAAHPDAPRAPIVEPLPAERGLQLGVRLGYALPGGPLSNSASLNTSMSHLETASVPIGIDAGYRLSPHVYLGGTLAWGAGLPPNTAGTCPTNASCFRQDAQLRAEARYYFIPERRVSWWASIGTGWEVAAFSESAQSRSATATLTGPVLVDFQLGFDVRRRALGIGPYLGLSLAEFLTHGLSPAETPEPTWIDSPSPHVWFTLGLRGAYGPW